ncbi:hypothetical protein [Rhizobium leucaenae]|jgi:hypothetical protein|uniref:Uncharacterized protein n=1 Tax=Rhizobium leucaenae TaxID=29450 RepID=A0A7W6ZYJ5_9HYPH|nr:hypothetical protein [Rhizobium leucaenae]MBB4571134.1 hypothetical protein [Rhizobium leucaenae]MBB6304228.1 hypothetical protein [Rhizobium leucaenae]
MADTQKMLLEIKQGLAQLVDKFTADGADRGYVLDALANEVEVLRGAAHREPLRASGKGVEEEPSNDWPAADTK